MSAQRAAQLVEAGLWLQMSGDTEGARRLFEQALKLDPNNARARQMLSGTGAASNPGTPPPFTPPPVKPPEPVADRMGDSGFDWGSATGLDPARAPTPPPTVPVTPPGLTPRGATPPPVSPLSATPPPITVPDDFSQIGFQPLAEPMPSASRGSGVDADEDVPVQLPAPEPVPITGGAAVIRPVHFAPNATSAWDSQSNPGVHLQDVAQTMGDAMDLVADPPAAAPSMSASVPAPSERAPSREQQEAAQLREEIETLLNGAKDLLDLDDHTGAIELILKAQALSPNDPQVQAMRERSEKTLQAMFESKLGDMTARPRVALKDDEIIWLNLDHRAGFVLAQIDGSVTFEDLFEVCGMSRLDTARILAQLVDEGVITT